MDRINFTHNIAQLLVEMFAAGEQPIIDYVLRSAEEQKRLYDKGLSKCDGTNILSRHQSGRAADVYFIRNGKMADPVAGWEHWHDRWENGYGGQPMIDWDKGHFEG
jgi:hypothetical protein